MKLDPTVIRQQIGNLLVSYPELAEDEILRADMIEGATEAFDFLSMIVRKIGENKALAAGTDEYVAELRERNARIDRRVEALRGLAFNIMQAADLSKAELAEATLSVRQGVPKLIITDESVIPDAFLRVVKSPDKEAIKQALKRGEHVTGATLSNAEPSLTIRAK